MRLARLKQQLLRTPEWRSLATRKALAQVVERDGFAMLARVLRGEATSAELRKADFICVARSWGCVCPRGRHPGAVNAPRPLSRRSPAPRSYKSELWMACGPRVALPRRAEAAPDLRAPLPPWAE